jgi:predicted oxidoreductase
VGGRRFFKLETDQSRRVMDVLTRIGANHGGAGVDQVALAFVLAHPARPVAVIGTGKLDRVRAAVEAESLTLDRQEWFEIWEASLGHEVP